MSFEAVVNQTPLADGLKAGLQAVKNNERSKIQCADTRQLNGSVDIDSLLKKQYPRSNRWDYLVGYRDCAVFIEVHPAMTSEVSTMLNKLEWLHSWLRDHAPLLGKQGASFHWVSTDGVSIPKKSKQYRQLAQKNLLPQRVLHLPV